MTLTTGNEFERLLPHRPPMLMLTTLLAQEQDEIHCSSVIAAHNPLLQDGLFPATGGLELLAQAAGALLGARAPGNRVRAGAIVQVKSFHVEPLRLPVGTELLVQARYLAGSVDAALFAGEVSVGEQYLCSGTLMIALFPEDTA